MRPSEALSLHSTQIREIALRHRVNGVRVFDSALHGDDTADSDLDLLVEPTAQFSPTQLTLTSPGSKLTAKRKTQSFATWK